VFLLFSSSSNFFSALFISFFVIHIVFAFLFYSLLYGFVLFSLCSRCEGNHLWLYYSGFFFCLVRELLCVCVFVCAYERMYVCMYKQFTGSRKEVRYLHSTVQNHDAYDNDNAAHDRRSPRNSRRPSSSVMLIRENHFRSPIIFVKSLVFGEWAKADVTRLAKRCARRTLPQLEGR
jgi:hypothetical protein